MKKLTLFVVALMFVATQNAFATSSPKPEPTASEFCVSPTTGKKFQCQTEGGPSVPGFLAAMETLCFDCADVLRDIAATREGRIVTTEDLQAYLTSSPEVARLLAAKQLYRKLLEGFSREESPKQKESELLLSVFTSHLEAARHAAIMDPDNKEKVREYLALENQARDRATRFANTVQAVAAEQAEQGKQ